MRTVSLYSGAGGLDIGFAQAGFEMIWANDIDPAAVATYRANLASHVTQGDIEGQRLPSAHEVDVVIGGPPCQGFSVAGKMDPQDPRSRHVWNFMGVVKQLEPVAFVMENVKALAENMRWSGLRAALIEQAESLGYTTKLFVLNSADFEVPQARERMFLIGIRGAVPVAPVPAGTVLSVGDVLRAMPTYGSEGNATRCAARITTAQKPVLRRSPYAGMLFNGQGRPLHPERPAATLPASMGGNRTPIIDERQLAGDPSTPWVEAYHRHLWDGGSPVREVPDHLRRLTVEEAAAIQTFPASYRFTGPQSAQYRQIGNAVPPRLGFHVAVAVRRSLTESPGKPVELREALAMSGV